LLEDFLSKTWVMDAEKIRVLKGERMNTVRIVGVNGELIEAVPRKPFPISHPYFLMFTDVHGNEMCIVEDYRRMDDESRKILEEILEKLYFIPRIRKVSRLETSGDEFIWRVETDRGAKEFRTRGRRSISRTGEKIVIIDNNDNVYMVEDINRMDERSRALLEAVT
jgi:ATP-binding cassette subfamily C protein